MAGPLGRAAALTLLAAVAVACDKDAPSPSTAPSPASTPSTTGAPSTPPVPVSLAAVEPLVSERTVEAVGTLFADQDAIVSAKVPGRLLSLHADVGDRVPADFVLARIDPIDYEMAVQQREFALKQTLAEIGLTALPGTDFDPRSVPTVARARFEVDNAFARLERVRKLFEVPQPMIPEQEFADRKTEYEVARRNLEVAELAARSLLAQARTRDAERAAAVQRLADASIRTPGPASIQPGSASPQYAVAERRVTAGEYVREGDPLFRIVKDDAVRFRAAVAERFASDLALGQTVRLHIEGQPREFLGKVARISPAIDTTTRTFLIEADFRNDLGLLRPGAFGRARIVVGEEPGVVRVPSSAVVSFAGIDRVFSVAGGRAVEHRVSRVTTASPRVDAKRVGSDPSSAAPAPGLLVQGLPPEITTVVTAGAQRLSRGLPVTVTPTTSPATSPATPAAAPRP